MTEDRDRDWVWPMLDDELVARLALPVDELRPALLQVLEHWPPSEPDDAFVTRALSYPWARPAGSFVLERRTEAGPITPAHTEELAALAHGEAPADGAPRRFPLLAIGSNGAPDTLIRKFGFLEDHQTRVLSIAGRLHDFDVGAVAGFTPYGSFPATLVPSPGAAVGCSLLWVTGPQLQALTWSELSYAFGRIAPITFESPDHAPGGVTRALVYVSRWGHLEIDGAPVSLEAMPAVGRTGAVWSQERLIEWVAGLLHGPGTGHRRILDDLARRPVETLRAVNEAVAVHATLFAHEAWTPFPGTAGPG